jgi:PAS domain S-box-containing protein
MMDSPRAPTALVVDDNPDVRTTTALVLQTFGFFVREARTGREALRQARDDHPELIVLDIGLPDLNGMDVCRKLKATPATARIPVLILSGWAVSDHDRADGLDGGAAAYLVKPADPLVLAGQARSLVRAYRDVMQAEQAAAAARASERRFRALVEGGADAVALLDADGTVTYASPGVTQVTGRAPNELVGRNAFELVHPADLVAALGHVSEFHAAPGATMGGRARCRHTDGTWRRADVTCTNRLDEPDVEAVVVHIRAFPETDRQAPPSDSLSRSSAA